MAFDRASLGAESLANLLPALASFAAVAESGSFTQAAKVTGVHKTVLSRRVTKLEESLELRLLHRSTRSIRVTQDGRELLETVTQPLADVLQAMMRSRGADRMSGTVRVATVSALSALWGPVAAALRRHHPELHLALSTDDEVIGLVEEGFDVALRTGRFADSTLVATKLGSWRSVLVASPDWMSGRRLSHPSHVCDHWLLYGRVAHADRWTFENDTEKVTVRVRPVMTADDAFVIRDAARAGVGVAGLPPFMIEDDLRSGRLVRLLPTWDSADVVPIWAVRPHRTFVPRRVMAVIDVAGACLSEAAAAWPGQGTAGTG